VLILAERVDEHAALRAPGLGAVRAAVLPSGEVHAVEQRLEGRRRTPPRLPCRLCPVACFARFGTQGPLDAAQEVLLVGLGNLGRVGALALAVLPFRVPDISRWPKEV